jgi:hypothetical protein
MIGLYPLTGQTTFLIHSPWFANLTIDLGSGKSLKITSTGGGSDEAIFVQSLKVNGQPWTKNWLTWNDVFAAGGSLDFVLGKTMAQWDTGPLPPSPASVADDGTKQRAKGYLDSKPKYVPAAATKEDHRKKIGMYVGIASAVLVVCALVLVGGWFLLKCVRTRRGPGGPDVEGNGTRNAEDDRLPEINVLPSFVAQDVVDGTESRKDLVANSAESKSEKDVDVDHVETRTV